MHRRMSGFYRLIQCKRFAFSIIHLMHTTNSLFSRMPFKITDMTTYVCAFVLSAILLFGTGSTAMCIQVVISDLFANAVACYRDAQDMFLDNDRMLDKKQGTHLTNIQIKERLKETFEYHGRIFQ